MASNTQSDLDVPIALRKPKRGSEAISPVKPRLSSDSIIHAKTPSTRRSKRVRFSDPGLFSPTSNISSTSLTPAFRRSSLGTPRQKRPATPGRPTLEGFIQFTPLTDILDERCQRRIRRNGLSDEMNQYEADKKTKTSLRKEIDEKDAELQKLRAELDAARAQPVPQVDAIFEPPASSQQRVDEIEAELEVLRQSFAAEDDNDFNMSSEPVQPMQPLISWAHVPHVPGPSSEGGDTILIHEDDDADMDPNSDTINYPSHQPTHSDVLRMGLELQAARAAKSTLLDSFRNHNNGNTSFDFHFADSPARSNQQQQPEDAPSPTPTLRIPDTPPALYHDVARELKSTTNRAEQAELALTALDIEITALGFGDASTDDTLTMISNIATHFRTARLELERLVPGESVAGFENSSVLPELLKKLKFLTERLRSKEAEVKASGDQHRNLKGNFEKAIIAAEKANETVKRLEIALDAAVEETLHSRIRNQQLERELEEKERNVSSLGVALDKYRADIARLEGLINELQGEYVGRDSKVEELEARVASETTGRRAAEVSAVKRLARINELESDLATSRRHASDLESQLASLEVDSSSSSQARVMEIGALNARISSLATALAVANGEVEKLKVTKVRLEERVRSEVERGAAAVETLQEQLVRSVVRGNEARKRYVNGAKVRIANWELEGEMETGSDGLSVSEDSGIRTPGSVRFAEWAEVETIETEGDVERGDVSQGQDQELDVYDGESGSESVPGSVQVHRGRSRYRKKPRLVSFDQARRSGTGLGIGQDMKMGKRRYDSGIGMGSDSEFGDEEGERVIGGVRGIGGMMTPELSSEGDADVEREIVDAMR